MNRQSNGKSKVFDGSVYYNLESAVRIYYRVEGDFYNYGTVTASGGVKIGIGESSSIDFSASYASDHYKYCYKTGYYRI